MKKLKDRLRRKEKKLRILAENNVEQRSVGGKVRYKTLANLDYNINKENRGSSSSANLADQLQSIHGQAGKKYKSLYRYEISS